MQKRKINFAKDFVTKNHNEKDVFVKSSNFYPQNNQPPERTIIKKKCKGVMSKKGFENAVKRGLFNEIPERGNRQLRYSEIMYLSQYSDKEWEFVQKKHLLQKKHLDGYGISKILRIINSKNWKKAVTLGIVDLVIQNKISYDMALDINDSLNIKHSQLKPEILSDIELLKQGKSVVPEFKEGTSPKEAFKKTKVGDAVQIGEKMFINDGKTLVPWKMTRKHYNMLFPPVKRFMIEQGHLSNCYFVSPLQKCMSNPYSRVEIYKSFESEGNDILCTIRAFKDFEGTSRYKELRTVEDLHLEGAPAFILLEQTYAKCALSSKKMSKNITLRNLMKRLNTDSSELEVMNSLLGTKLIGLDAYNFTKSVIYSIKDIPKNEGRFSAQMTIEESKKEMINLIKKLANDDRYLLNLSTFDNGENIFNYEYKIFPIHSYAINGYDPKKDILTVTNPHNGLVEYKIPFKLIEKYINALTISKICPINKKDKNSISNLQKTV